MVVVVVFMVVVVDVVVMVVVVACGSGGSEDDGYCFLTNLRLTTGSVRVWLSLGVRVEVVG